MLFYRIFPAIAAGCAALMDIQRAKVDNGWLLFCVLVSLFTRIWKMDVSSLGTWICGLLVPILILGILFIFRMLGAGAVSYTHLDVYKRQGRCISEIPAVPNQTADTVPVSYTHLEERLTYWTLNCPIRDFMVLYNMEKVFLEHWNFSRKRANITMTDTENVTSV